MESKKVFGQDLCSFQTQKLKDNAKQRKANLESQLEGLKKDFPLFQKNSVSLIKLADIWEKLEIDFSFK